MGDRSSQLMSIERLKIGAAVVLCAPFVPMLFQGEEFGASTPFQYFTNHQEPDLARAVSEGRRREFTAFGWNAAEIPDPQDPKTFLRSKLDWTETDRGHHTGLLAWHRQLIDLRRKTPDLSDGRLDRVAVGFSESEQWLTFRRGSHLIALNLSKELRRTPVPFHASVVLASASGYIADETGVTLPPDSVAILREKSDQERTVH
jgi:maltooligosyltrehalose trehalohydrolase